MSLDDLYRQVIMDHYQNPRNKRPIAQAQLSVGMNNPSCGDEIRLMAKLGEDGRVQEVGFEGNGCSISMAAASMMTEAIKGKSLSEALRLGEAFRRMLTEKAPPPEELGDLASLEGVSKFPMRVKCATLAFNALKKGAEALESEGGL